MQKKQKIITHQKNCLHLLANSLAMITNQKIRINHIEEISFKSDAKEHKYYQISTKLLKVVQKRLKISRYQKKYINVSANSLALIITKKLKSIIWNEISLKSDAKNRNYYQIPGKLY